MSVPVCPICCDTLGRNGGPTSLPCGHNGCLQCMEACQDHHNECPLCRAPFEPFRPLAVNHQLRDLIAMATRLQLDEQSRQEGWEEFPVPRLAKKQYYRDLDENRSMTGSPSAPPVEDSQVMDVLSMEPPAWLPDSASGDCMNCHQPFQVLVRLRHHCRLCGKLYCGRCSSQLMLLPPKFNCQEPKRVCDMCADLLRSSQAHLAATLSLSSKQPVFDVLNTTSLRAFVNNPLTTSLADDVYKCANSLNLFRKARKIIPHMVPSEALKSIAGVAILSEVKLGFGFWSGRIGTGLVVSRGPSGEWSAPSAIMSSGAAWGLQAGGELSDVIIVLPDEDALTAFTGDTGVTLGGSVSLSVGVGGSRSSNSLLKVCKKSRPSKCYTFGLNRGLFAGLSIGGAVIKTRVNVNHSFYGLPVSAEALLSGSEVRQPPAASILYEALNAVFGESGGFSVDDEDDENDDNPVSQVERLPYEVASTQTVQGHSRMNLSASATGQQLYNNIDSIGEGGEGSRVRQEDVCDDQDGEVQVIHAW